MPSISSCPACRGEILLAALDDPLVRVRCPHCQAEFAIHEVSEPIRELPPEALPVGPQTAAYPHVPLDVVEPASGVTADVGPGLALAEAMAPATRHLALSREPSHEGESRSADEDRGDSFGVRASPRNKQGPGAAGQLLGTVAGAVVGLALGYYILLWIGGARADFLELRSKLPDWMVPGEAEGEAADGFGNDLAAGRNMDGSRGLDELLHAPPDPGRGFGGSGSNGDAAAGAPDDATSPPPDGSDRASAPAASSPDGAALETEPDPAVPQFGPLRFTPYSMDQLALVLRRARAVAGCALCDSTGFVAGGTSQDEQAHSARQDVRVPCPDCGGQPWKKVTPDVYEELCSLAEAVTFAQLLPGDASRDSRRMAVQELLIHIGQSRENREIIGRLAEMRLSDAARQTGGILLAGTVQQVAPEGNLYRTQVVLFGAPTVVHVLSWQLPQPPLAQGDRVLVLGSIVDQPRANLRQYIGEQPQVVWGGLPQKIAR